jgi:hypothetical protein
LGPAQAPEIHYTGYHQCVVVGVLCNSHHQASKVRLASFPSSFSSVSTAGGQFSW